MGQRGTVLLYVLLGILVFALLGVVAYYLEAKNVRPQQPIVPAVVSQITPIVDQTANWKVYTSKDRSFSLKYPPAYSLVNDDSKSALFGFSRTNDGKNLDPVLNIGYKDITDLNSVQLCSQLQRDKLPKDQLGSPIIPFCIEESFGIKNIILSGRQAKNFHLWEEAGIYYDIVQTVDNPKLELKMNIDGVGLDKDFTQILSTFTFTNQSLSTGSLDTSSLETYTNQQIGISFKYPNTMKLTQPIYPNEVVGFIGINNVPDTSSRIIDIRSLNNPTNLSIQAYNKKDYNTWALNNNIYWPDLPSAQTITIGGKQAYFLPKSSCDPELCDRYLILIPREIIEIYRLTGDNPYTMSDADSKPILNTIISTLTFTN